MPIDLLKTLAQLVAIPSVNPMGRGGSGPHLYEARLTEHLESFLRGLGLETERQEVWPGRENLIARLDGAIPPERGGPLILLDAHQDTVPIEGMTIDPWAAEVRQGRLYGRGACDTKGGMAAILALVARLAKERPRGAPSVVAAFTVDEEYTLAGAAALASRWAEGRGGLIPRAPDAAVVAEPTGLDLVVAHKGVIRWRCRTLGRAAHSSHPELGENAIFRMGRVLAAVERHGRAVLEARASHPLCGACTMNVGTIHGGSSINIVPERCEAEIELRVLPGEEPEAARRELIDRLAAELRMGEDLVHEPPYMEGPPMADDANARLAERLSAAVRQVTGACRRRGVAYATNAAFYARAGTPAVVFGPGSIEQAHTRDEWLSLAQLERAAEILYRFVCAWGEGLS
ncbi:MAG: M20 family metallopeptidase [Pirellulales bacterium]